ncbi:MAG TPA: hypothetical protein VG738_11430 [Chitinophagaceae bacterium]|nr:hypothetical protein [Chitinophagaceae bacterium]
MFGNSYYSLFIIIADVVCIVHCLRTRRDSGWIYFIVLVPVIGVIAYIATQMFSRRDLQSVQSGLGAVLNPTGSIKKLEQQLRFSDTFNNRVALADAYLAAGQREKAVDMYESSLTGAFTENEYVLGQLVVAYFETGRYKDVITTAKKIYTLPQFARSRVHILYAMSLEKTGNAVQAENEFRQMKGRFANYEARYQYGQFLVRNGRSDEARRLFNEMLEESGQLTLRERKAGRTWFVQAKEELKKMAA